MPFVAKDRRTGDRVDILTLTSPRSSLPRGSCICPLCDGEFIIKSGLIVKAHFAHKRACTSDWQTHPESAEHLAGKLFLLQNLPQQFEDYRSARIELEVPLPEIKRVADILVTLESGWQIAHEVQLASITTEQLTERTNDYNSIGIDVVWWLGNRASTQANADWCYGVFGFCLGLAFHRLPSAEAFIPEAYSIDRV